MIDEEVEITTIIEDRTEEISVLQEIRNDNIEANSFLVFSNGIEITILLFILIAIFWRKI